MKLLRRRRRRRSWRFFPELANEVLPRLVGGKGA